MMLTTISAWFAKTAIFGNISKFIAAHWRWFAALAVALLLWWAWSSHERTVWNEGFNAGWSNRQRALSDEQQSHAITRASLNQAISAIAEQNAANEKLAEESKNRLAAAAQNLAAAKKQAATAEAAAKALDASSAAIGPRGAPCVPSEAFLAHSGEL